MEDRQYDIELKRLEIEQNRLELERSQFENKKSQQKESASMFWKIFNEVTKFLRYQTVIDMARLPDQMRDNVYSIEEHMEHKELERGDNGN